MALKQPSSGASPGVPLRGSAKWSLLWLAGMVLVFAGERLLGGGGPRAFATVLGLVVVIGAMVVRVLRAQRATPDRQRVERMLLALYGLGLFAVALYFVQSDLPAIRGGKALEHSFPILATILAALWPAIWVTAAWPIALIELSYAQMARAPRLENGRIRDAMLSGFGLAFAFVFAFSVAYIASERDAKVDLAYFRTTRPGEVTRKIVRNLDQPIEAAIFFPAVNDVREELTNYLTDLAKESGQFKVTQYDFDINPVKAKEYGVSTNGIVVFVRGGRHEQLGVPMVLEQARTALRNLDKEVQQRLLMVVKPTRTILVTQGHGERSWEAPAGDTDKRSGIKSLRDMLIDQSYDVRYLGAVDGLGQDVPKDGTLVMVLGPQKAFPPEESASLNRFVERGGRLLLALDPENGVDMHEVLDPLQLEYKTVTLANEQAFARKSHNDSDHANLVTATYTSHPSVTTLSKLGQRAPTIYPGVGWINTRRDRAVPGVAVDAPIKAHFASFEDKNGNFRMDPGETKRAWEIGAVATKKDARVFVLADSDCLSDLVIRAAANELLALDVVHWLMGDEAYQGAISTEADAPVVHTRKQDVIWFYSTIFVAPLAVIALGFVVTRRKRAKKAPAAGPPAASPSEGGQS